MPFALTREFNINLDSGGGVGALVRSKTDLTPADLPVFIAGDTFTVRVRLLTPSGTVGAAPVPTALASGSILKLAARPASDLEEDFLLFESGTFTETIVADPADVYYEATLNLNTEEFRDAVDAESPLDLLCDFEVQNSGNTARLTIPQFRGSGRQQVYRGDEPPVSLEATWPTRAQIVRFMSAITGYTGGGSTNLDGIVTVGQSYGLVKFRHSGGTLKTYRLVAGTDAESSPDVIRPDDYHASTNAFVWKLESEGATSGDGTGTWTVLTPSATGNATAVVTGVVNTTRIAPTAGAGAYTYKLVLPVATAGKKCFVDLALPASTNPTIEIRDLTTSGTILFAATGTADLGNGMLTFTSDGTNWFGSPGNFIGFDA